MTRCLWVQVQYVSITPETAVHVSQCTSEFQARMKSWSLCSWWHMKSWSLKRFRIREQYGESFCICKSQTRPISGQFRCSYDVRIFRYDSFGLGIRGVTGRRRKYREAQDPWDCIVSFVILNFSEVQVPHVQYCSVLNMSRRLLTFKIVACSHRSCHWGDFVYDSCHTSESEDPQQTGPVGSCIWLKMILATLIHTMYIES